MPDMHMQIDPAGRNPRTLAIDALDIARYSKRRTGLSDTAVGIDQDVDRPVGCTGTESHRFDVCEKHRPLRLISGRHDYKSFRSLGSSRSRSPSPTICSDSTERMMAKPGNKVIQSARADILTASGNHRAPGGDFRADAEAKEREAGFRQHGAGKEERALHEDRRYEVTQHMPGHDVAGSKCPAPATLRYRAVRGSPASRRGRYGRDAAHRRC